MLTVTKTYKVAAEMLVQGEDHDANDVTGPQRHTPYVLSMRNPKLTVGSRIGKLDNIEEV